MFIESEADQLLSDAEQFRRVAGLADYRIYEVAGAAHLPTPANPTDHLAVARALFLRGDAWVRRGILPPPDALLETDPSGVDDPVYGLPTGVLRDDDLNARGGVQLPDVAIGRARFIAADFSVAPLPGLNGLVGAMVDLACAPRKGSTAPRFRNHGEYVSEFTRQAGALVRAGFLLPADGERLRRAAAETSIGKPGTCP